VLSCAGAQGATLCASMLSSLDRDFIVLYTSPVSVNLYLAKLRAFDRRFQLRMIGCASDWSSQERFAWLFQTISESELSISFVQRLGSTRPNMPDVMREGLGIVLRLTWASIFILEGWMWCSQRYTMWTTLPNMNWTTFRERFTCHLKSSTKPPPLSKMPPISVEKNYLPNPLCPSPNEPKTNRPLREGGSFAEKWLCLRAA
jgi:hypothetical protein